MKNHFYEAPTAGSHDPDPHIKELEARVLLLEQQVDTIKKQTQPAKKKQEIFKWKKIKKFFSTIIAPILVFVPKLLNSISRFNESRSSFAR